MIQHRTDGPKEADNGRLTPLCIIEAARATLGEIDLDPASSFEGQARVLAKTAYGPDFERKDALLDPAPWVGRRVFLNPPGGRMPNGTSSVAIWWSRLHHELATGHVEVAIWVGFALESLRNTQGVLGAPGMLLYPLCVPRKRLRYASPAGRAMSRPTGGSAICLVGLEPALREYRSAFVKAFNQLGDVRA
jgi:hypothetical protein